MNYGSTRAGYSLTRVNYGATRADYDSARINYGFTRANYGSAKMPFLRINWYFIEKIIEKQNKQ